MRRIKILLTLALILVPASALSQTQPFAPAGLDFTLELPSPTWRLVSQPDGAHQHAEFVYGDRLDGLLRVRKELVDASTNLSDLSRRDQDAKLRFLPGFVEGKQETFPGRYNGRTMSYEYTNAGKLMLGRVYYLQANDRTVYTLHFTGLRDKLQRIRNQTDLIARSLQMK